MRESTIQNPMCFDDILLVPQESPVSSRKDVDLSTEIGRARLRIPVISAPMDTVTEVSMAVAMAEAGGLGIIHRYMSTAKQCSAVHTAWEYHGCTVGAAVGATDDYLERAIQLVASGASLILVDTANGHSNYAIDAVGKLRAELGQDIHIMAGNVATREGYIRLGLAGADSVRVGIGGGSVCTTREVSGHGLPTLASIMDCSDAREYYGGPAIIADGGIKTSGDAVKAFAAGAQAVMLGSLLAGTDESPGEVINGRKQFRGMASNSAQQAWRNSTGGAEGITTTAPYRGTVSDVLADFCRGIQSGCSYSGVNKLVDLCDTARFVRVTGRTVSESRPHGREQ